MSFRRRTYPEVLQNLLTSLTGGIAAETQPFPPNGSASPPVRMPLLQAKVADIVSVFGTRNGETHQFRKGPDFTLDADGRTLVWPAGAELPDAGTVVQVSYYGAARPTVVTDVETGSVVRTLAEAFALELASVSAQLEAVYTSAFIDTADGRALDNVVSLLGIDRVRGGRATTQLEFTRAGGTRGEINIPAGTRVIDPKGEVEYETTASAVLAPEQSTVRVAGRDLESNDPVAADTLTVLPVPIAGIVSVTNPAPSAISTRDETDDELRTRAKNFLHGSERATLGALKAAIAEQGGGITADVEEDATQPGTVSIRPHAEALPPTVYQRLVTAIEDVRPAGVQVVLLDEVPPQKVDLELRLTTSNTLLEQDLRAAQDAVRAKVTDYFARLPVREPGSINKLVGLVLGVSGVEDVRILSASLQDGTDVLDPAGGTLAIAGVPTVLGALSIADPNLPTLLLATVTFAAGDAPPDQATLESELTETIAYLNGVSATEPPAAGGPQAAADAARRTVSFGKLLRAITLPNKPGASLEDFDTAAAGGAPPALPDASAVLPYRASFVFTQTTGLSQQVAQASQQYVLTPFERLSLGGVSVAQETA